MTDYRDLEHHSAEALLSWAINAYGQDFAIACSFQKEDLVMVDMAARVASQVHPVDGGGKFRLFALDTGRLHEETYQMMEEVRRRYGVVVETVFPDREEVERMLRHLKPRERSVIELRFGLGLEEPRTLEEVGRRLKLSRERVRQIEERAKQKLRLMARTRHLKDYLN